MYNIKLIDKLAPAGRRVFNEKEYSIRENVEDPHGILVHSTPLHDMTFGKNLQSIVRIGAGVNTIPVDRCTEAGICVFNCPGGNANAVKELTLAAMIMAMRSGIRAMEWVKNLPDGENDPGKTVEKGKEVFKGPELMGKTIGILGVGNIGSRMAQACHDLGMKVYGYDPYLSHNRAQELTRVMEFTEDIRKIYEVCDIITVHTPLNEHTKGMVNAEAIAAMKDGVYLVNYARGPIVDDDALCAALDSGKIRAYATDFPTPRQMMHDAVVCTPHLGAGTPEADENCSVMAARQTMDYLENGNITNSVNLPNLAFGRADGTRITLITKNVVGMLGRITDTVAQAGFNIENLLNKSRGTVAYTILDFDTVVPQAVADQLETLEGVIRVRRID